MSHRMPDCLVCEAEIVDPSCKAPYVGAPGSGQSAATVVAQALVGGHSDTSDIRGRPGAFACRGRLKVGHCLEHQCGRHNTSAWLLHRFVIDASGPLSSCVAACLLALLTPRSAAITDSPPMICWTPIPGS